MLSTQFRYYRNNLLFWAVIILEIMAFYGNTIKSKINLLQSGDIAATWYKLELFKNS